MISQPQRKTVVIMVRCGPDFQGLVLIPKTEKFFSLGQGHSPVLHCASLLRIILRVISARVLKNDGFFFTVGPRHRGKSSFSRKRVR